jgi:hypothetical protein
MIRSAALRFDSTQRHVAPLAGAAAGMVSAGSASTAGGAGTAVGGGAAGGATAAADVAKRLRTGNTPAVTNATGLVRGAGRAASSAIGSLQSIPDAADRFFAELERLDRNADFTRDKGGRINDDASRILANLTHEIGRGSDSFPFGVAAGEIDDWERVPQSFDRGAKPPPGFDPESETFTDAPYPLSKGGVNPRAGGNSLPDGLDATEANRRLGLAKHPVGTRNRPPVPRDIADAQQNLLNAKEHEHRAKQLWPEAFFADLAEIDRAMGL